MIGPIVVRTARDRHWQPVGAVIGEHQKVGSRLGARIRARSMQRGRLREEEIGPVEGQIAVDLVRGDLVIALDAIFAAGVHERRRAENVGLQEDARILNGTIDVALGRKVDDDIGVLLFKETEYPLSVADIQLDEAEIGFLHDARKRRKIARISEFIEADDAVIGMRLQHIKDEIAADEPRAARDKNGHLLSSFMSDKIYWP